MPEPRLLSVIVVLDADANEKENHTSLLPVPVHGAVMPPPDEADALFKVPVLSVTPIVKGVAPAHSSLPGAGRAKLLVVRKKNNRVKSTGWAVSFFIDFKNWIFITTR